MDNIQKLETGDWQKLSPISIFYFTATSIFDFASNFFYLLPVIALNFSKIKEQPYIILAACFTVIVVCTLIGVLKYLFYWFKVTNQRIEIKQGIFKKSYIDLPFERIQNVKLSQPLYYRIHDYSCIELDTAGSAKQEAKIVALKTKDATNLRIKVLETVKKAQFSEPQFPDKNNAGSAALDNEVLLNRRSIKDLIIHGVTNNRIWIFLGALTPFYNAIVDALSQAFESIGFDIETYFSMQTQAWWEFSLHILFLAILIMSAITLVSIAGSILMFYGYTLSRAEDRYIRRSGLLTKQEVNMKLSRIQFMVQAQDWLDILFGRVNLSFEQNKSGVVNSKSRDEQTASSLLIPSISVAESIVLMKDAMPAQSIDQQVFKAISKRFIWRGTVFVTLPTIIILFNVLPNNELISYLAISAVFIFLMAVITLRWMRWGYSCDGEYLYIRKGFLGVNYYCFPLYKVQQAQLKQNVFIRPYQLASLNLLLASGSHQIPYMPAEEAKTIINSILDLLVTDKRSWM